MWNPTPDDPAAEVDRRIGLIGAPHGNIPWLLETVEFLFDHDIRQIHVVGDLGSAGDGDIARVQSLLVSREGSLFLTGSRPESLETTKHRRPVTPEELIYVTSRMVWLPRGWRGQTMAGGVLASFSSVGRNDALRRPTIRRPNGPASPLGGSDDGLIETVGTKPVDVLLSDEPLSTRSVKSTSPGRPRRRQKIESDLTRGGAVRRAVELIQPAMIISSAAISYRDTFESFNIGGKYDYRVRNVVLADAGQPRSSAILEPDSNYLQVIV